MNFAAAWAAARDILAVRLDAMGDLLMTTPALRALKERPRTRTLTLLTSSQGAEIARALPFVDDVIAFTAPWMKCAEREPVPPMAVNALADRLRARRFDAAVVFTVFTQSALPSALLLLLADIPLCAAYCRENPYALLTQWLPDSDRDLDTVRHEVERQIQLVEALGARVVERHLQFTVQDDARRAMSTKAAAAGLRATRPWLVVHPGASAPSRRYPIEHYAAAVATLAAQHRWQIVIVGSSEDVASARAIARDVPDAVVLAGRLDVMELAALIERAQVVVCNNSLAAHLCAAVGTPVVDLYALTNPQHTPWQVRHVVLSHDVPCRHCLKSRCPLGHHACLANVPPDAVVAGVATLTGIADAETARRTFDVLAGSHAVSEGAMLRQGARA